MLVNCDFGVHVGDYYCICEGIARFRDEAPFVWYIAEENGICLVWDIKMKTDLVHKLCSAVQSFQNDPTFEGLSIESIRSHCFQLIFHQDIKEKLKTISMSKQLWDRMGGNSVYDRYFPSGLTVALRDISGGGLSWHRDCQGVEASVVDSGFLDWLKRKKV